MAFRWGYSAELAGYKFLVSLNEIKTVTFFWSHLQPPGQCYKPTLENLLGSYTIISRTLSFSSRRNPGLLSTATFFSPYVSCKIETTSSQQTCLPSCCANFFVFLKIFWKEKYVTINWLWLLYSNDTLAWTQPHVISINRIHLLCFCTDNAGSTKCAFIVQYKKKQPQNQQQQQTNKAQPFLSPLSPASPCELCGGTLFNINWAVSIQATYQRKLFFNSNWHDAVAAWQKRPWENSINQGLRASLLFCIQSFHCCSWNVSVSRWGRVVLLIQSRSHGQRCAGRRQSSSSSTGMSCGSFLKPFSAPHSHPCWPGGVCCHWWHLSPKLLGDTEPMRSRRAAGTARRDGAELGAQPGFCLPAPQRTSCSNV